MNDIRIENGIEKFEERKRLMENTRNIEVLESVKQIITLSNSEFVTVQMTADYFEVPLGTIKSLISENNEELVGNGLITLNSKELKEKLVSWNIQPTNFRGYFEADGQRFANNKNTLISKRVLLNIGMLLRDSEVAKELRKRILDIVHDAEQGKGSIETIVEEINEEEKLSMELGSAIVKGDMTKVIEVTTKLNELKNKRIVELEDTVDTLEGLIDSVINKNSLYSIRDLGKSLSGLKFNIKDGSATFGANNIFQYLRDRGILYYNSNGQNRPYAKYEGYIKMKLSERLDRYDNPIYVCYFTKDGLKWFFKRIVKEEIIDKDKAKEMVKNIISNDNGVNPPLSRGFGRDNLPF